MDTVSLSVRIVRALSTVEQMLHDRKEFVGSVTQLTDADVVRALETSNGSFVKFCMGLRDVVFFTKKLKTADIAKAASDIDDARKGDVLLVTLDTPMTVHARSIVSHFGPMAEVFTLASLGINIARSKMVPDHVIVDKATYPALKAQLNVSSLAQLPLIESTDPMAKYIRARPGDVVKVTRLHPSCGTQVAYRYCRK